MEETSEKPRPDTPGRARELFEQAIELASMEEREAFLTTRCSGDPDLYQSVAALLQADEEARSFLPDSPQMNTPAAAANAGARVGRYRLLEKLGEGGCGVVFLAEQEEPVRRKVALKVIKTGMDTPSVVARFEVERQALALMDHPNIARVYDAGTTESGRPFFVMERVHGCRITDYCNQRRLSIPRRLELFIQVCHAVQHAHQKGVIHRDLKPSNVLVAEQDGVAIPKIIDFGIAKATEAPLGDGTSVTHGHVLIGTPAYMSPEQTNLNRYHIDTRSDIYSLGVLLYELITGTTPFDEGLLLRSGLDELRRIIREVDPVRPSNRLTAFQRDGRPSLAGAALNSSAEWIARVRGDLDWIVMRCLEKDRTRRYETANGLAQDIRRHLANEPVVARPPGQLYLLGKFIRRNRGAVTALSAIALLLIMGIVFTTRFAVRARHAELRERDLRERAERNERLAREAQEQARIQAYTSDMRTAAAAVASSHFGQAHELLQRHFPKAGETDLRGMEWRYLWQAAHGNESQSLRHEQFVKCVRFSPDGHWLATSTFGTEVRIFDSSSLQPVATFPTASGQEAFENLAFSPDSRRIAVASVDGLAIRDTRDWSVEVHWSNRCDAVAFSPDGLQVAGFEVNRIIVRDLSREGIHTTLPAEGRGAARLAFTHDGRFLAVARQSVPVVTIWDLQSARVIRRLEAHDLTVALAISPDDRWIAAANSVGELQLWDRTDWSLVLTQKVHSGWTFAMAFSPDGTTLATGGADQVIRLWNMSSLSSTGMTAAGVLKGHRNEIWSLDFSADGSRLASGGKDASAKVWDIPPPTVPITLLSLPGGVPVGFLQDSRQFVFVDREGPGLQVWDVHQARCIRSLPVQPLGAVTLNGTWAAFGTSNGTAELAELTGPGSVQRIQLRSGPIVVLRVSFDHNWAVTWDPAHSTTELWDLEKREPIKVIELATAEADVSWSKAQRIAFSPNCRWLAYAGPDYTIRLFDLPQRENGPTLRGHLWHLQCLRFSDDSSLLASGSWDAQVRLWDPSRGIETMPPISGHLSGIGSVSFSPDGRTLATRGGDDSFHLWSTRNGAEMLSVPGGMVWFFDMLARDGNAIAWEVGGFSGSVEIQHLPTITSIDEEEQRRFLNRPLKP